MVKLNYTMIAVLGLSVAASAQGGRGTVQVRARQAAPVVSGTQVRDNMRMAVRARVMPNAPYSGETVTEFAQSLPDGNRIARTTTTRVYRDSQGRTRVEQMNADGASNISISDPVAGETLVLYPESRTAYRGGQVILLDKIMDAEPVVAGRSPGEIRAAGRVRGSANPSGGAVWIREKADSAKQQEAETKIRAGATAVFAAEGANKLEGVTTREELGQQTMEGLLVSGTRTTTIIEAGTIGNELPIRIVSEQWFSPDLQILVLTRHSDPRSGETTFRLTNVSRAEPDRSLFTLPSDYELEESAIRREER